MTMSKWIYFIIVLLMACELSAQTVQSTAYDLMLKGLLSHTVPEVSVEDIQTSEAIVFVDARERSEYEISHLKDAIWVGYDDFDMDRVGEVPKNSRIIVYCSVGYRSEKVSEQLIEAGYQDVSNLYGGIFEWVNQQRPIVSEEGKTDRVHAFDKLWGIWVEKGEKVYE